MSKVIDVFDQDHFDYISPYFTLWVTSNSLPFTLGNIADITLVVQDVLLVPGGTTGADVIATTDLNGATIINGLKGNDTLVLNSSNSFVDAGPGNDFVMGVGDNNSIEGGKDADFLV